MLNSYEQAFVMRNIGQTASAPKRIVSNLRYTLVKNETLYVVGIALIELCYRKSILELHEAKDGSRRAGNADEELLTMHRTADRLVSEIADEAGEMYSEALWQCIRCDFDRPTHSLKDDGFCRAVFSDIVALLKWRPAMMQR